MLITFTRNFDWPIDRHMTIAFKAGHNVEVDNECALAAFATGAAMPDFQEDAVALAAELADEPEPAPKPKRVRKKAAPK